MKKIVCVTGTRPQLVKHAVLLPHLQALFEVASVFTAQHYQFELNELLKKELMPREAFYNLSIDNQLPPAKRLGEMILKLSDFFHDAAPDAVLVYGDTDTTLAGAIAANKMGLKLIHVESGERSYNTEMPEEHNRKLTDAIADILFCVSQAGKNNLLAEQNKGTIIYSGDIMKDLLLRTAEQLHAPLVNSDYLFCTIHRNYNQQNKLKLQQLLSVLQALETKVVFAVHPATHQTIELLQRTQAVPDYCNIQLLPPISYQKSVHYQKFAKAIITDSGGIQKEAYWLQKRCFTFRKETEWIDTLKGNWNQLFYEDVSLLNQLMAKPAEAHDPELYGNGQASAFIAEQLHTLI